MVAVGDPSTQQVVVRRQLGLRLTENPLEAPPGALFRAENAVVDREGVISCRRGLDRYGSALSNTAQNLMHYLGKLVFLDNTTIKVDSAGTGTFTSWTGAFAQPTTTNRMRFLEQNGNFYFNTERGVMKNDSLTGTPIRSGMPPGLDVSVALAGTGDDWMPVNSQVGYVVVFGRTDGNQNLLLGSPSFGVTVTNPVHSVTLVFSAGVVTVTHVAHGYATGDVIEIDPENPAFTAGPHTITVTGVDTYTYPETGSPPTTGNAKAGKKFRTTVTFTIPQGMDILADDFWELYRSAPSAAATEPPFDRYFKLIRKTITSGDITATQVTFIDTRDEGDFAREQLYTNDTSETRALANDRPPWCKYMVDYKDHLILANLIYEHEAVFQLLGISGLVADTDTITLGTQTYTFSTSLNPTNRKFLLSTAQPTDAQDVAATMRSFCECVNRDPNNANFYAQYTSGIRDEPGSVRVRTKQLNTASFTVTTNTSDKFSPPLPITSQNYRRKNGLAIGKAGRPEAVPFDNFDFAGLSTKEITGLVSLKDGVIIATENGVFILSGESDGLGGSGFVIDRLDPGISVLAPETVVELDGAMVAYSTQGVVRVVAGGYQILSRQVEKELNRISKFPQFTTLAIGCAYPSDRKYLLGTQGTISDTTVTTIWVYNYIDTIREWTTWKRAINSMIVVPQPDDRLYMAHAIDARILKERKSLDNYGSDFLDEDITAAGVVSAFGVDADGNATATLSLNSYHEPPQVGFAIARINPNLELVIKAITTTGINTYAVTLDGPNPGFGDPATIRLRLAIPMRLEWLPEDAGSAEMMKQFSVFQVTQEKNEALHNRLGFLSDTQSTEQFTSILTTTAGLGWGENPWGTTPWGDEAGGKKSTPLRAIVPTNHQICRSIRAMYEHIWVREPVNIVQTAWDVSMLSTETARRTG